VEVKTGGDSQWWKERSTSCAEKWASSLKNTLHVFFYMCTKFQFLKKLKYRKPRLREAEKGGQVAQLGISSARA
jgi:hypothetical protein